MTCNFYGDTIMCSSNNFRKVVLTTGEKFIIEHHSWSGAIIWEDEDMTKEISDWWDNENISKYVYWFYETKQYLKN